MLMTMSMAKLLLLAKDNQNEVQHDFFGDVMPLPLVLAPCQASDIKNVTIAFLTLRQSK